MTDVPPGAAAPPRPPAARAAVRASLALACTMLALGAAHGEAAARDFPPREGPGPRARGAGRVFPVPLEPGPWRVGTAASRAQPSPAARRSARSGRASLRGSAGSWRMQAAITGAQPPSAILSAVRTWGAGGLRRPPAGLILRCAARGGLEVFATFPPGAGQEAAGPHASAPPTSGPHAPSARSLPVDGLGGAERLGGPELLRELLRSKAVQVEVEGPGGLRGAMFAIAGIEAVARRLERACGRDAARLAPSPARPEAPAARPPPAPPSGDEVPQTARAVPEAVTPPPTREREQPPTPPAPEEAPPRLSAPLPPSPMPPAPEVAPAPAPPRDLTPLPAQTSGPPVSAAATQAPETAAAETTATSAQRPKAPTLEDFLARHGPNHWGAPIYGWYKQCLDHLRIDRDRVWYLSGEELTYLSKGESDAVRLSMRISTTRDLAVEPRRVICEGTARQRSLIIRHGEIQKGETRPAGPEGAASPAPDSGRAGPVPGRP